MSDTVSDIDMGRGRRRPVVLFVDSDPTARLTLEVALKSAGFDVLAAAGEADALGLLERAIVDLVIADADLFSTFTTEIGRRMRPERRSAGTSLLLIGSRGTRPVELASPIEVDDQISRPVWEAELVSRARLIVQRRLQHELVSPEAPPRPVTEGGLAEVAVADLLQAPEFNRRQGVIQLTTHEVPSARVYFRDGRVVDAELGELKGREAIYQLLAFREGEFAVHWETVDRPDVVGMHPRALVIEGLRRAAGPLPPPVLQATVREPGVERRGTVVSGIIQDNRGTGSTSIGWAPALVPPVSPRAPVVAAGRARRLKLAIAGAAIGSVAVALVFLLPGSARFPEQPGHATRVSIVAPSEAATPAQPRFETIQRKEEPPAPEPAPPTPSPVQICRDAQAHRRPYQTVEVCRRAFLAAPDSAVIAATLAHAELDRGNNASAGEWARKAVALDPTLAEAHAYLGFVAEEAGRRREARAAYRRYLELAPRGPYAPDITAILREELEPPGAAP
jgi:DNA-binding response OmpR family regulator